MELRISVAADAALSVGISAAVWNCAPVLGGRFPPVATEGHIILIHAGMKLVPNIFFCVTGPLAP